MANAAGNNHQGFIYRGESMTRVETFVAAAFAFSVTMLVISVGAIPQNFAEFVIACKQIPAFAASFAVLTWIWHSHAVWSRRFGLEDAWTIVLSCGLIFLVLIYVYPLRIMMQSLFAFMSDGFFPGAMSFSEAWQIRFMFAFYAMGFVLLCLNFIALYGYARRQTLTPALSAIERFDSTTEIQSWIAAASISSLSLVLSILLPLDWLQFAGFSYFLFFPVLTIHGFARGTARKALLAG
ncbi:TMEM175 family protein [Alteromonas gilva]|uniref:TMEM175 family protein n=1 Tax=Alteromonas gilva TaxID=2987522 RepID=A0ABT5L199_9ALTE|nr:TMEM175 family protein [Alteromonas gilva]MDC8830804.1 TMEM175 family protein [Alteromonas gilva]